jgi:hypothetical protein
MAAFAERRSGGSSPTPAWARGFSVVLAILVLPAVALGDEAGAKPPQSAASDVARGVPAVSATPEQRQVAQARYVEGTKFFAVGDYNEALASFQASYAVVASPNSHLMIARTLRQKGQLARAYEEFGKVESEGREMASKDPKYAESADKASQDRAELRPRLGLLSLRVRGAGATVKVLVGAREIARERWNEAIPVDPGEVEVAVQTPKMRRVVRRVTMSAGASDEVVIDFTEARPTPSTSTPPPAPSPPTPPPRASLLPYAAIVGGLGVAGFIVFGVAGAKDRAMYKDLQGACPGNVCPPSVRADIDQGRTEQKVANIGLVVGAAGLATGLGILLYDRASSGSHSRSTSLSVGPGGVLARGTF